MTFPCTPQFDRVIIDMWRHAIEELNVIKLTNGIDKTSQDELKLVMQDITVIGRLAARMNACELSDAQLAVIIADHWPKADKWMKTTLELMVVNVAHGIRTSNASLSDW